MLSQRMPESGSSWRGLQAFSFALLLGLCFLGYYAGRSLKAPPSESVQGGTHPVVSTLVPQSNAAAEQAPPVLPAGAARPHRRMHGAAGVPAVLTAPAIPAQASPLSLPTGTRFIEDRATTGLGKLKTINRTDEDAYIILVDASTHTRVRQVYVKAHDAFTMEHLDQGRYQVFFTTGLDWNGASEEFKLHAAYLDFGQDVAFAETPSAEGVVYDDRTITLNAVPHGTAQVAAISRAQFHAMTGRPLQAERPVGTTRVMSSAAGRDSSSGAAISEDGMPLRPAGM